MSFDSILFAVILITLLVLLLLAGVVITFFIAGRQRIRQQMVLTESKLNFEKELRIVETEVSESVLTQFARELHDNIGQLLTALHIQVENQKLDHPQIADSFRPTEIYISEIEQQLRMLSRTLNNDFLGNIGLLAAIQFETDRLRALKRFDVHFEKPAGVSNLDKGQELMVFRIFQEIVQNALRHATAKNFFIKVNNENESFILNIEDDGKGFEVDAIMNSSKASGLKNMKKRALLSKLDLQIKSSPGKGTIFIITKLSQ